MLKNHKHRIFLLLGILTLIVGCIVAEQLKPSITWEEYTHIGIGIMLVGLSLIFIWAFIAAVKAEGNHDKEVQQGKAPVYESNCTHISGLASFTAEGKIRIYVDRIHFTVAGTHYELPIERIINMGISTTSHTEYDLKAHPMRGVIGGLLLGEFGLLWGAEHELVKTETKEYFLVIAYRKDEATKFITLGNVDCKKIISTVSKYVDFQERNVQL